MTNEEAIKTLSTCRGCKYITARHECIDTGYCFEAKKMSIEALRKRNPHKPKYEYNKNDEQVWLCQCGNKLYCIDRFNNEYGNHQNYCECCGQAIDWRD